MLALSPDLITGGTVHCDPLNSPSTTVSEIALSIACNGESSGAIESRHRLRQSGLHLVLEIDRRDRRHHRCWTHQSPGPKVAVDVRLADWQRVGRSIEDVVIVLTLRPAVPTVRLARRRLEHLLEQLDHCCCSSRTVEYSCGDLRLTALSGETTTIPVP